MYLLSFWEKSLLLPLMEGLGYKPNSTQRRFFIVGKGKSTRIDDVPTVEPKRPIGRLSKNYPSGWQQRHFLSYRAGGNYLNQ